MLPPHDEEVTQIQQKPNTPVSLAAVTLQRTVEIL